MVNKIIVIGNVGRDAEMRYTRSGPPVTNFSLAVNRTYTKDGNRVEEVEWFTIEAWNKLAEISAQFVQKGRKVFVEGRFHLETWTGNDGKERARSKITAQDIRMLDRSADDGNGGSRESVGASEGGNGNRPSDDDLPF